MIWSAYMGLPLSLENVGAVLKLKNQKLKEGKDLIRYFCTPCKPTKANGGRTRNLPEHAPDKWELFKTYNKRDVEPKHCTILVERGQCCKNDDHEAHSNQCKRDPLHL